MDYLMLACLGILTTVVPMRLLEIVRAVVITLVALLTCCSEPTVDGVSNWTDKANQWLTSLTVYQVQSIRFSSAISKLTYENVLWLVLQMAV